MRIEEKGSNIDVFLTLVIVLLVLAFGGGLWITAKTIIARLDQMSLRLSEQQDRLEIDIFALRKQIQDLDVKVEKMRTAAKAPAPTAALPAARP